MPLPIRTIRIVGTTRVFPEARGTLQMVSAAQGRYRERHYVATAAERELSEPMLAERDGRRAGMWTRHGP
jgi:hypothetical protein